MPKLIDTVRPGDKVTIITPQGQQRTGRAVMRSAHGGWVLNMGGKHGTPGVADDGNVISVRKGRKKTGLGRTTVSERFVVSGPSRWRRSVHTTRGEAVDAAKKCSEKFPNAVCRVEKGLPGLQTVVVECNRNDCYGIAGLGRRKTRKTKRKGRR